MGSRPPSEPGQAGNRKLIPHQLPAGLKAYKLTPDFTPGNLPAALQSQHSTKAGVWGLLQVLEG
ncbi:DUF1971 domain-containing protein [Methylobacillus sp.]|uniref:DUF1971 domain-containing protein n=1 Tax=Methylobacillus sp. TaxID=56818 RepID=UPI00338E89D0